MNEELRRILRLARSGSLERAWTLLEQADTGVDPAALTLKARLVKDKAKRAQGSDAARLFAESADLYEQAAGPGMMSYPLINAATLAMLAGQQDRCSTLARQVLAHLEIDPDDAGTPYWLSATRSEALLLLGQQEEARAALDDAMAKAPRAWEDHAATIGQFALICAEKGLPADWLDTGRPPRSLQFTGIMDIEQRNVAMQDRIAAWLESENVGFGFGALAAGSDIWIAEALLARGAELHIVLPCNADTFRQRSVAAVDEAWLPRFDALVEQADTLDELDTASAPSPAAVGMSDAVARGLAIHNARMLQSEALGLRIAGPSDPARPPEPGLSRESLLTMPRREGGERFAVDESGATRSLLRIVDGHDPGALPGAERVEEAEGTLYLFDRVADAWIAASDTLNGQAVALDLRFIDEGNRESGLSGRVAAMADLAEKGQVLATKSFAFALLSRRPDTRIETLGEVRSPVGQFPLFALR